MINFAIQSTARINFNGLIAPALKLSDVRVIGIASRDVKNAEHYQRVFNFKKHYETFDDLLLDPEVDAVYISTPNIYHVQETLKAIRAGKHVLCEKPFSFKASDIKTLHDEAIKHNVYVMDAIHYNHYPTIAEVIQNVRAGHVGKVNAMNLMIDFPIPPHGDIRMQRKLYGGAWMHMGCYLMHFCEMILPGQEWDLTDLKTKFTKQHVDLSVSGTMTSPQGQVVTFRTSYNAPKIASNIEIDGSEGFLHVAEGFTPTTFYRFNPYQNMVVVTDHNGIWPVESYNKTTYDFQLDAFKNNILSGKTGVDANYRAYVLLENIYKRIYEI